MAGVAQSNRSGESIHIPERTPELEALFKEGKALRKSGTAAEINANRLAIKNAWAQIDPEVAALYKPLPPVENAQSPVERPVHAQPNPSTSRANAEWGTDMQLYDGYVDAMGMDVNGTGDIYIASVENFVGSTSDDVDISVYRSVDDGDSFELWKSAALFSTEVLQAQPIVLDGIGESYLLVYFLTVDGVFQAVRWNIDTGDYSSLSIADDVETFQVDKGFSMYTSALQVYATYTVTNSPDLALHYSARSTAGEYGFGWVDQYNHQWYGVSPDIAYGTNGGCYITNIGGVQPGLFSMANTDFLDPTSWDTDFEELESHEDKEIMMPTIAAARVTMPWEQVVVIASTRDEGSTDDFVGTVYRRDSGNPFVLHSIINAAAGYNVLSANTFVRGEDNATDIQTSFVKSHPDPDTDNAIFYTKYEDVNTYPQEAVSDGVADYFAFYPSVVAETSNNEPCMAFAGTDGIYGYGLYFDKKTTSVSVKEEVLENFKFYPNPAQNALHLSASEAVESVTIYSQLGQQVLYASPQAQNPSIDVSDLASGVYSMKVEVNGKTGTYRVVKE